MSECHFFFRSGLHPAATAAWLAHGPLSWVSPAPSLVSLGRTNVNASWPTPSFAARLLILLWLTLLDCSPFALPGFHRASSLLWAALTPRRPACLGMTLGQAVPEGVPGPLRERTRSPSVTHATLPTIPAPTT